MSKDNTNKGSSINERDIAIVRALAAYPEGLTLAELSEVTGLKLMPGHITSVTNKGLAENIGQTKVKRYGTRKVETYRLVTAEPLSNADGEPYNYNDSEKEILAAFVEMDADQEDNGLTLKQVSTVINRRLYSGSISGLSRKGNIVKAGKIDEACEYTAEVSVYKLVDGALEKIAEK